MNTKKWVLSPCSIDSQSGYGSVVAEDYVRWGIKQPDRFFVIHPNFIDKVINLISMSVPVRSRWSQSYREFLSAFNSDIDIHNDDLFFGDSWLFDKKLSDRFGSVTVRFHNLFLKLSLDYNVFEIVDIYGFKFGYIVWSFSRLEKSILLMPNIKKEFITLSDLKYAEKVFPGLCNHSYHNFSQWNIPELDGGDFECQTLMWLGGVSAHKKKGLKRFINDVFFPLKVKFPKLKLILYGNGTRQFDCPSNQIYGCGFFEGNGYPSESCIFINPDLDGLGIKVKLRDLMMRGRTFITTPEGNVGYEDVEYKNRIVAPLDKWVFVLENLWEPNAVLSTHI